jgi:hypothetical protein
MTRFKIGARVTRPGVVSYFVYRHLGFPAGWSWSPETAFSSREEAEKWIEGVHKTERTIMPPSFFEQIRAIVRARANFMR